MKQLVNKNLITLKCVLFCFFGGVGCIYPFLPLHMLAVGLDRGEARLVSAVVPCIALLGPAIFGPLVDKLSVGRGSTGGQPGASSGSGRLLRIITAVCLILSAIFYLLILVVPSTERFEARRPQVLFMCNQQIAIIKQEVCTEGTLCSKWKGEKSGVLAVSQCEAGYVDENMTWLEELDSSTTTESYIIGSGPINHKLLDTTTEPETDGDENYEDIIPPHLCTQGVCHIYMKHEERLLIPLILSEPISPNDTMPDGSAWCEYRSVNPFHCENKLYNRTCQDPGCASAIRCQVLDPYDVPDGVLAEARCRRVKGNPVVTFWSYFVIRCLADIWPTAALALLGAACVIATRETSLGRGDVGRQIAVGTLGLAIFPPLAGLAVNDLKEANFVIPFLMHAILMIIAALILIFDGRMPLSTPEWWWHTATGVLALPMNTVRRYGAETAGLFIVMTLLGILCSAIDSYLPWTIYDLRMPLNLGGWTSQLAGLTLTVGALPAVLFLWWAEAVVDFIGHSNLLITAFIFYCLRYTALAATTNTDWVLVSEALEVFTMSLVWVTAVLYFRHLVPRKYTTTGQALPVIAHFCIGRCVGALIGGLVTMENDLESARTVRSGLALAALLVAGIYLTLYHLLLAPRCAAQPTPPHHALLQGLNTNGASNGSYSPMRVYHEERARKGHFRY